MLCVIHRYSTGISVGMFTSGPGTAVSCTIRSSMRRTRTLNPNYSISESSASSWIHTRRPYCRGSTCSSMTPHHPKGPWRHSYHLIPQPVAYTPWITLQCPGCSRVLELDCSPVLVLVQGGSYPFEDRWHIHRPRTLEHIHGQGSADTPPGPMPCSYEIRRSSSSAEYPYRIFPQNSQNFPLYYQNFPQNH